MNANHARVHAELTNAYRAATSDAERAIIARQLRVVCAVVRRYAGLLAL